MMTNILLTIVIPSYNMESYLPRCLDSLIVGDDELFHRMEVIIVNDGSKDGTSKIAHEYHVRYPDVFKVVDKSNGNYGSCINAALPLASGVFIKILDADDSFDTNEFEKLLNVMAISEQDSEQVDLFLTDFIVVGENGVAKGLHSVAMPSGKSLDVDAIDRIPLFYMHSIAYRTDNLRSMGYRQTEGISYTDTEWSCYPMRTVRRFRYEPLPVYRYLQGRVGQTISAESVRRSLWMLVAIAERMVESLTSMPPDLSKPLCCYLQDFVVMMNVKVYNTAILEIHDIESDEKLKTFDAKLEAQSGYVHKQVMDALVSRKIGFRYGRYWRRRKRSNTLMLKVFRLYVRVVASVLLRWGKH